MSFWSGMKAAGRWLLSVCRLERAANLDKRTDAFMDRLGGRIETLEKRADDCEADRTDLRRKCKELESEHSHCKENTEQLTLRVEELTALIQGKK